MSDELTNPVTSENTPLAENSHVKELFTILNDNGKDTTGLSALLGYVKGMEDFVKLAENRIADMKSQLDTMKEIQNHPVKTKLQNAIKTLETAVAEIKTHLVKLKSNIAEGCKQAVAAFKEKGITALDKIASFLHLKSGLQSMKNNISQSVKVCDNTVTDIKNFSIEYHKAGRAIKNMARMAVGKEPIDTAKEAGKLSRVISAPYRAEKACLLGIRKSVSGMISKLDKLEQSAENRCDQKAAEKAEKEMSLIEKIEANKEKIKQLDLDKGAPLRTPKPLGAEL